MKNLGTRLNKLERTSRVVAQRASRIVIVEAWDTDEEAYERKYGEPLSETDPEKVGNTWFIHPVNTKGKYPGFMLEQNRKGQ